MGESPAWCLHHGPGSCGVSALPWRPTKSCSMQPAPRRRVGGAPASGPVVLPSAITISGCRAISHGAGIRCDWSQCRAAFDAAPSAVRDGPLLRTLALLCPRARNALRRSLTCCAGLLTRPGAAGSRPARPSGVPVSPDTRRRLLRPARPPRRRRRASLRLRTGIRITGAPMPCCSSLLGAHRPIDFVVASDHGPLASEEGVRQRTRQVRLAMRRGPEAGIGSRDLPTAAATARKHGRPDSRHTAGRSAGTRAEAAEHAAFR